MKGILLAGGNNTRLYPATKAVSKQLLPIFDKPMIYYPLSTLMLAGIRDILIITRPSDLALFRDLLGNGEKWGLNLHYKEQHRPGGIAEALVLGAEFLNLSSCCLILGDNIFYGAGLKSILREAASESHGGRIFAYSVADPENYGVLKFDKEGQAADIIEKPIQPISNWAVPGIYFYDSKASAYAAKLVPSSRGELEITDLNKMYLSKNQLKVSKLGRGFAWLDTGTPEFMASAIEFVKAIEQRQGVKVCCPEEISYQNGWIDDKQLELLGKEMGNSSYGRYLIDIAKSQ